MSRGDSWGRNNQKWRGFRQKKQYLGRIVMQGAASIKELPLLVEVRKSSLRKEVMPMKTLKNMLIIAYLALKIAKSIWDWLRDS